MSIKLPKIKPDIPHNSEYFKDSVAELKSTIFGWNEGEGKSINVNRKNRLATNRYHSWFRWFSAQNTYEAEQAAASFKIRLMLTAADFSGQEINDFFEQYQAPTVKMFKDACQMMEEKLDLLEKQRHRNSINNSSNDRAIVDISIDPQKDKCINDVIKNNFNVYEIAQHVDQNKLVAVQLDPRRSDFKDFLALASNDRINNATLANNYKFMSDCYEFAMLGRHDYKRASKIARILIEQCYPDINLVGKDEIAPSVNLNSLDRLELLVAYNNLKAAFSVYRFEKSEDNQKIVDEAIELFKNKLVGENWDKNVKRYDIKEQYLHLLDASDKIFEPRPKFGVLGAIINQNISIINDRKGELPNITQTIEISSVEFDDALFQKQEVVQGIRELGFCPLSQVKRYGNKIKSLGYEFDPRSNDFEYLLSKSDEDSQSKPKRNNYGFMADCYQLMHLNSDRPHDLMKAEHIIRKIEHNQTEGAYRGECWSDELDLRLNGAIADFNEGRNWNPKQAIDNFRDTLLGKARNKTLDKNERIQHALYVLGERDGRCIKLPSFGIFGVVIEKTKRQFFTEYLINQIKQTGKCDSQDVRYLSARKADIVKFVKDCDDLMHARDNIKAFRKLAIAFEKTYLMPRLNGHIDVGMKNQEKKDLIAALHKLNKKEDGAKKAVILEFSKALLGLDAAVGIDTRDAYVRILTQQNTNDGIKPKSGVLNSVLSQAKDKLINQVKLTGKCPAGKLIGYVNTVQIEALQLDPRYPWFEGTINKKLEKSGGKESIQYQFLKDCYDLLKATDFRKPNENESAAYYDFMLAVRKLKQAYLNLNMFDAGLNIQDKMALKLIVDDIEDSYLKNYLAVSGDNWDDMVFAIFGDAWKMDLFSLKNEYLAMLGVPVDKKHTADDRGIYGRIANQIMERKRNDR